MDTKFLRYIVEIAEQKNMTKAAEHLYISQSSLSQYLSKLEAEVGTPLFTRNKGEMLLTPAGELYVHAARNVIQIQRKLYRNIANLSQTGHLIIGITAKWAMTIVTDIMPMFQSSYPGVRLELFEDHSAGVRAAIQAGKVDIALMPSMDEDVFPSSDFLRQEEFFLALPASHPFARSHDPDYRITLDEFASDFHSEYFMACRKGTTGRRVFDNLFEKLQLAPEIVCEVNNVPALRDMVAKNIGITFIPSSYAVKQPEIAYFSLRPMLYRNNIIAYRKNLEMTEAEQAFVNLIKSYPLETLRCK